MRGAGVGPEDNEVRGLANVAYKFLQDHRQARLRRRGRGAAISHAVTLSRLDQAQLFDVARHRGLGHVDTARGELASQLGLGRSPAAREDFQDLSATVDVVHAMLYSQFISTPLPDF